MLNGDAIVVDSVSKSFGAVAAVKDLSFVVRRGEVFGIVGPNGAGKTTMLRMIMDIFRPDAGRISVYGQAMDDQIKQRVGYLPEERGIYVKLKVRRALEYFARLKGLSRPGAQANAEKWLRRFGIEEFKDRRIETLSKGNQQKVQLIVAFIADPEIVILDEPLAGLDPVNARLLAAIIREMAAEGKTVIFSSHQMPAVENLCERLLMVHRGEAALYGPLDEIRRSQTGVEERLEDIYVRIVEGER